MVVGHNEQRRADARFYMMTARHWSFSRLDVIRLASDAQFPHVDNFDHRQFML